MIKSTGQISFVKIAEIDWIEVADYYALPARRREIAFLAALMSEFRAGAGRRDILPHPPVEYRESESRARAGAECRRRLRSRAGWRAEVAAQPALPQTAAVTFWEFLVQDRP